ncbi:hypothetical protein FRC12_002118 [Ceratobasidium sp. 428]|nr:hypothetical protein FRC12_002118 [Ceratobasidium sp. 428]
MSSNIDDVRLRLDSFYVSAVLPLRLYSCHYRPPIGLRRPHTKRTTRALLTRALLSHVRIRIRVIDYLLNTSIHLIKTRAHIPITPPIALLDQLSTISFINLFSWLFSRSLYFAPVLIHSLTPTPTALVSTRALLAYNPTVGPWSARILRWVPVPGCLRDQRNPDRRLGLDKTSHQFPTIQHVPGSTSTDAGRPSVRPVGLVFGFGGAVGYLVGAERQSDRNDQ